MQLHALTPRQNEILRLVTQRASATPQELAEAIGTSPQTIRREIASLHQAKLLVRFHGGVGPVSEGVRLSTELRKVENRAEKQRMANAAAAHISPGMSIFLDTGTTMVEVARALRMVSGITVFTADVLTAAELIDQPNKEVHVAGGQLYGSEGRLVGSEAVERMREIRVDLAIVGFSGFDADGTPMDFEVAAAPLKRMLLSNARDTIAVADHTKLTRRATVRVVELAVIRRLITDEAPASEFTALLDAAGTALEVAERGDGQK